MVLLILHVSESNRQAAARLRAPSKKPRLLLHRRIPFLPASQSRQRHSVGFSREGTAFFQPGLPALHAFVRAEQRPRISLLRQDYYRLNVEF